EVVGQVLDPQSAAVGSWAQSCSVTASMTRVQPPPATIAAAVTASRRRLMSSGNATGEPGSGSRIARSGDGDAEVLRLQPGAPLPDLEARGQRGPGAARSR